jgi:hypothetical protein
MTRYLLIGAGGTKNSAVREKIFSYQHAQCWNAQDGSCYAMACGRPFIFYLCLKTI